MSSPAWFILQSPPDLDIDVNRWKGLAWDRVKLLEKLPQDRSQVVRDHFPPRDDDTLRKIYEDYRLGAYFLRLVAATNRRLEAWLIESEGDLFEYLYSDRTNSTQKRAIFKLLFGSENVMEYEEFKHKMDESHNQNLSELYHQFHSSRGRVTSDFLICVHYSEIPWMVSNRRGYLRKGWVTSNEVSFRGSLKKAFEKKLEKEIEKAQDLLGVNESIDQGVQEIEQNLAKHTQIRSQFSSVEFEGKDLQSHPEIFPPCMIYLFSELEKTGRLTHVNRLQLGFFLKKIGMSVDEQLHYWYEKSVDNINISYTEFQRTSGYQIRHLYGMEGGKKDYNVPKCSTIATSYFCPFVHLAPAILIKFLSNNYLTNIKSLTPSKNHLEKIISVSSRDPTLACKDYFALIYKRTLYRKIVHPLQWARYASKFEGLMVEEKKSEPISNQEVDKSQ